MSKGTSYIKCVPLTEIMAELRTKRLRNSYWLNAIRGLDAVVICVPTPIDKCSCPDLSHVLVAGAQVGRGANPDLIWMEKGIALPAGTKGSAES